jgi:hypothetical protein
MNAESGRMWKEAKVAYLKEPVLYSLAGTEQVNKMLGQLCGKRSG